jgi:CDGSH-type Zn-finger protein
MEKNYGQKWKKNVLKKEEDISMTSKQCLCGRSKVYPFCDGSHKIKKQYEENATEVESNTKEDGII